MDSQRPFLSVVIPAYNESDRIGHTLAAIDAYLSQQKYPYEIIVVNDGSTDDTVRIVNGLKSKIKDLKLIDNPKNHGKGWVVKQGMLAALGDIRLFMDADNSTSVDQIERMLPKFKEGYEVVIGSRRVPGAKIAVHQPFWREQIGRIFNLLVRVAAGLPYADTQAGFKAFSAAAARRIFPKQTIYRFAFDVEILVISRLEGFKIAEVPITWINDAKSHVKFKSMAQMLIEVLTVRWKMLKGEYR